MRTMIRAWLAACFVLCGAAAAFGNAGPPRYLKTDKAAPTNPAPQPTPALDAAMTYANANGVTSIDHMGTWADLAVFERAHRGRTLRTRIYAAVPLSTERKTTRSMR